MITSKKIKIYKRFNGQIDDWSRFGSKLEKSALTSEEWYLIESLVQDIEFTKKGLSSSFYKVELNRKLKLVCEDEKTIIELEKLV